MRRAEVIKHKSNVSHELKGEMLIDGRTSNTGNHPPDYQVKDL